MICPYWFKKIKEHFEMIIVSLRSEKEVKSDLCKTIRELPVTLDEIKILSKKNDYIFKWMNNISEMGRKDTKPSDIKKIKSFLHV